MKISRATIQVMVCSCKATKSGKGYVCTVMQDDVPFVVFSKREIKVSAPQFTELTVDLNCYVDRQTGEFKQFCSVAE